MPKSVPVKLVHLSGVTAQRARQDTTALLIAKLVEVNTGEQLCIEESMQTLLTDAERCGSVVLCLLNLVTQYATQSMTNIAGLQQLVDFLIKQMEQTGNARRN